MKKIIFIHLLNDYSGSPKVLSQVITATKDEYDVELHTGKSEGGFLTNVTTNHKQFFYYRSENRRVTLFNYLLSQLILFFKLLKYINKDVVLYVNTMLPFSAGFAGWVMRKPVIYHVHEISLTPILLKRFLRAIIQLTAGKIVYVSQAVRTFESFKGIHSKVIYNALDAKFLAQAQKRQKNSINSSFNVLMIGSLKAYKGVFEFMEIAEKLSGNYRFQFSLVLNADVSEIQEFFSDIQVPSNVTLVPRQNNINPYYQNASLILNLSRPDQWVETFGLTIIEAMAYGLPVIVPPVGGPAEIVREGKEGYLISSYDTSEIAEKLIQLVQNRALYDQLSRNAFKRAEDFNEETFRKEILQVINE